MDTGARYFDLVCEMKENAYNHRLRPVVSVKERGIKPTAPAHELTGWKQSHRVGLLPSIQR